MSHIKKMTTHADHYYIKKTLEGDVNAFSALVKKYENMVFTIAIKMMKNREEAEDVAQEAFIKSYKSLDRYKGDAKFSTWLYRISYNLCLDKLKSSKRHTSTSDIEQVENELVTFESDAFEKLVQQERRKLLEDALKQLKEEDQLIMTLFYFEELSIKEISKITGINTNHIKIKLYRCRLKLVSLLQNSMVSLK